MTPPEAGRAGPGWRASRLAALALALWGGAAAATQGADPAFGHWLVENGRAIVRVAPCADQACGRIVWLAEPYRPDGRPKRDVNNPDPAERHRTLCDMRLIWGLERAAPGLWRDGRIYNSRDGETYGVRLTAEGDGELMVRGYLGVSLLGRSQTWRRAAGDRGGCSQLRRPGRER